MRLDLATLRVMNVNLAHEPGFCWLTLMTSHDEARALRLSADQVKDLLVRGWVEVQS